MNEEVRRIKEIVRTVDEHTKDEENAEAKVPEYFTISPAKFILMSVLSFSLYELYWFYKNWEIHKQATMENTSPFWRAFFAPLYAWSFFNKIKIPGDSRGSGGQIQCYTIRPYLFHTYCIQSFAWNAIAAFFPLFFAAPSCSKDNDRTEQESWTSGDCWVKRQTYIDTVCHSRDGFFRNGFSDRDYVIEPDLGRPSIECYTKYPKD